MFFVFLGTRQRRTVRDRGSFSCPYCVTQRAYEHVESRSWFHVFWVPLFPIGSPWESVRCTVCGGEWGPAVLHQATA